ncbi:MULTISPECIES: DUF2917 domain-containing protein [Burkholderiaceae]|uniref:DUF2917 domain-containing protein n=1 Tax=Burkholderiaceae TaxID=119060 RepID=UPI00095A3D3C|nr:MULTISPECIES: DUF2917 domain-containing protein [Burkholderiaceae]MCF2135005.1 DUF2917 domain-containing protein [Mycetohabitans sp. B3]MCG1040322.1 DUF2917 domain-containing protein [Mycetohabitans sp. B7]SIT73941.1 Protein of unknown function [Burkholderia sp. b14]
MKPLYSSITFEVQPGQTVPLRVSRGVALTIEGERVWITRSADEHDYWVASGESLSLRPGELMWLGTEGTRTARVTVALRPHYAQRVASWWSRRLSASRFSWHTGWLLV